MDRLSARAEAAVMVVWPLSRDSRTVTHFPGDALDAVGWVIDPVDAVLDVPLRGPAAAGAGDEFRTAPPATTKVGIAIAAAITAIPTTSTFEPFNCRAGGRLFGRSADFVPEAWNAVFVGPVGIDGAVAADGMPSAGCFGVVVAGRTSGVVGKVIGFGTTDFACTQKGHPGRWPGYW